MIRNELILSYNAKVCWIVEFVVRNNDSLEIMNVTLNNFKSCGWHGTKVFGPNLFRNVNFEVEPETENGMDQLGKRIWVQSSGLDWLILIGQNLSITLINLSSKHFSLCLKHLILATVPLSYRPTKGFGHFQKRISHIIRLYKTFLNTWLFTKQNRIFFSCNKMHTTLRVCDVNCFFVARELKTLATSINMKPWYQGFPKFSRSFP